MRKIIQLTLLADFASCIVMLIVYSFNMNLAQGLYIGILTFGNILLPTLAAVLIYKSIKLKTTLKSLPFTLIVQCALLFIVYTIVILIWAAGESALLREFSINSTLEVYDKEFSGFLPALICEAFIIPIIDNIRPVKKS